MAKGSGSARPKGMSRRVRSATAGTAANTRPSTRLVMGMDRLAEERDRQLQARERAIAGEVINYERIMSGTYCGVGLSEDTVRIIQESIEIDDRDPAFQDIFMEDDADQTHSEWVDEGTLLDKMQETFAPVV